MSEQKCRMCGCTDEQACPGGCYWIESDLCSACFKKMARLPLRENAYLLNCRHNIVDALCRLADNPKPDVDLARRAACQALVELDAFRHGALQRCAQCPDIAEAPEGEAA